MSSSLFELAACHRSSSACRDLRVAEQVDALPERVLGVHGRPHLGLLAARLLARLRLGGVHLGLHPPQHRRYDVALRGWRGRRPRPRRPPRRRSRCRRPRRPRARPARAPSGARRAARAPARRPPICLSFCVFGWAVLQRGYSARHLEPRSMVTRFFASSCQRESWQKSPMRVQQGPWPQPLRPATSGPAARAAVQSAASRLALLLSVAVSMGACPSRRPRMSSAMAQSESRFSRLREPGWNSVRCLPPSGLALLLPSPAPH